MERKFCYHIAAARYDGREHEKGKTSGSRMAKSSRQKVLKQLLSSEPAKKVADLGFSALYRLCLINEHDGYIIPNFVKELALVTDKTVFGLIQIDIPFALRAGQNIQ
jgi:hypothetical protein